MRAGLIRSSWATLFASSALAIGACDAGGVPRGWRETPDGTGPVVDWDLSAKPLPEVPLPNDAATWPDPTSPTGRRINASMVAPTRMESRMRRLFDGLDGWGTFAPITVSFDVPIDTDQVIARQGGNRYGAADWPQHAVYLVDLETGIPVPLDINGGNFVYLLTDPNRYYTNDPRGGESNLLFETVAEDLDGDGELDPGEDTDFDGVLDRPNTFDGTVSAPMDTYDRMLWFWERETNTMLLRPMVPMKELRRYAVVLTDRLRGLDGQPVRSPFPYVHHIAQREDLRGLPDVIAAHPEIYGDLATRGWDGIAFAWTFTTQSVTADLLALRSGLYGDGEFAELAEQFPPEIVPMPMVGGTPAFPCADPGDRPYVASVDRLRDVFLRVGPDALGLSEDDILEILDTYSHASHFAIGFFESPYLLGDPDHPDVNETWQLNRETGEARIGRDLVPMLVVVPKETETRHQPFPVAFYGHGYTSTKIEALAFAGLMAKQGVATVAIDAASHGLGIDEGLRLIISNLFAENCLDGMGRALTIDRARDQNGDSTVDSAGDFWSAYVFHTRDVVRQSVLDHMMAVRVMRSFAEDPRYPGGHLFAPGSVTPRVRGARPVEFSGDTDGDGAANPAGDFDGDGTPDVGGFHNRYYAWGQSLGGILSGVLVGAEPAITAAVPTAGAGGLLDVGIRSVQGGVKEAVILRLMGPLVVSVPSEGPNDDTSCAAGERSLRFIVPDLNDTADFELGCAPGGNLAEGDAVIVRNLSNDEARCAGVGAEGRFRIGVPSDIGDRLQIEIYEAGRDRLDYGTCEWRGERPRIRDVIDRFRSTRGIAGAAGRCPSCATFQGHDFLLDDPLTSPAEGLGLRRQTPELRRFVGLAQTALEPGDPVSWARHVFLEPIATPDAPERVRNLLVLNTIGDMNVPLSAGNAFARAAGILPFMPADAPDAFAEHRAPATFRDTWGSASPNDLLIRYHVLEGIARLERHPVPGVMNFLADPDDLADGRQFFDVNGRPLRDDSTGPGYQPVRVSPPLRWVRESRPMSSPLDDVWTAPATSAGMSGVLNAMVLPRGVHGFDVVDAGKDFDMAAYLASMIGWYFASGGTDLRYHTDPAGHHCLESLACNYGE